MTRPGVHVHPTRGDTASHLADDVTALLAELLQSGREPRIVLTGGSMSRALHRDLVPRSQNLEWARVSILWGDERFVAAGSDERNEHQAQEDLLVHLPTLSSNIYRMPSTDDAENVVRAAAQYAAEVRSLLSEESHDSPAFDLVILGIGEDGHVASLFPDRPPPTESVIAVEDSPKPPPERISMGYDLLNRARRVWFVAAGEEKAQAVEASVLGDPTDLPAARVRGMDDTRWYLDTDAASRL